MRQEKLGISLYTDLRGQSVEACYLLLLLRLTLLGLGNAASSRHSGRVFWEAKERPGATHFNSCSSDLVGRKVPAVFATASAECRRIALLRGASFASHLAPATWAPAVHRRID